MESWLDQGAKVRVYVATNSDALRTGRRYTYPFGSPNSNGVPVNWTRYIEGASSYWGDVTMSVKGKRFNVVNDFYDIVDDTRYGIYRDFSITPANNYYVFTVQARTMKNKSSGMMGFKGQELPSNDEEWWLEHQSEDAYELMAAPLTYPETDTTKVRVKLFTGDNSIGIDGISPEAFDWGVQFTNPAILVTPKNPPAINWHEITCDVKSCQSRYGRENILSRYEVGIFSVVLTNDDGDYSYQDPHPFNLRPGRWVKATLTLPGTSTETPMFYGLIDSIKDGFDLNGKATSTITVVDPSNVVANVKTPTLAAGENSSTNSWLRARSLLYASGIRDFVSDQDPNPYTQQDVKANGSSVRDSLCVTAESEGAAYYTDREGHHCFYSRYWYPQRDNHVTADFVATSMIKPPLPPVDNVPNLPDSPIIYPNELETDWSRDRVINIVSIANVGGTAQVYEDTESIGLNGPYTYQRHDFVNWDDFDQYSDYRAADILGNYKDAKLRADSLAFSPVVNDCWQWMADAWLNNLIRVWYVHPVTGWAYVVVTHVQSITHRVTTKDWTTTLTLDKPYSFVRMDFSSVGWDLGTWDGSAMWDI